MASAGVWYWEVRHGEAPEELWRPFPADVLPFMEEKFVACTSNVQEGSCKVVVCNGKYEYELDFSKLEQRNLTTGRSRKIRRCFQLNCEPEKDATMTLKEELEQCREQNHRLMQLHQQQLRITEVWRRGSPWNHQDVKKYRLFDDETLLGPMQRLLRETSHPKMDGSICNVMQECVVTRVRTIIAKELYSDYMTELNKMKKRNSHSTLDPPVSRIFKKHLPHLDLDDTVNEVLLFHGLHQFHSAALTMMKEGSDMRLANPKGLYGEGLYFAEQACKSHQHTDEQEGEHCIFVCRTLLGTPFKAVQRMVGCKRPPASKYDSIVADVGIDDGHLAGQLHREFIVFDGRRVYPEFAVYYRLAVA